MAMRELQDLSKVRIYRQRGKSLLDIFNCQYVDVPALFGRLTHSPPLQGWDSVSSWLQELVCSNIIFAFFFSTFAATI